MPSAAKPQALPTAVSTKEPRGDASAKSVAPGEGRESARPTWHGQDDVPSWAIGKAARGWRRSMRRCPRQLLVGSLLAPVPRGGIVMLAALVCAVLVVFGTFEKR